MSGHPNHPPGYGYGAPPGNQPHGSSPYGIPPPQGYATPYGAPPGSQPYGSSPYGAPPPQHQPQPHGQSPYAPVAQPYGAAPPASPYDHKPPKEQASSAASGYPPSVPNYSSPFASLVPSNFPPGTDPNVVACFGIADQDGSGIIDDKELQRALSSYNQSFSLRTVHLLMYLFTNSNARKIGPKEFTAVFYSLQSWRDIFERFDRDRSGKIDSNELREALQSLGFAVSPLVLDLLVSKFDKTGGKSKAIEYDNFIECCLTVKGPIVSGFNTSRRACLDLEGLTEKFKEKDKAYSGSASFTYEAFMLTVLPFLIA